VDINVGARRGTNKKDKAKNDIKYEIQFGVKNGSLHKQKNASNPRGYFFSYAKCHS
jgi:hypothetical protein